MGPLFFAVGALALIALLQFSLSLTSKRRLEYLVASQVARLDDCFAKQDEMALELRGLKDEIDSLHASIPKLQPPGQMMNLGRRSQVLRMYYRGDSPSRIASVLQISQTEVDLLLKVHRIAIPSSGWSRTALPARGKSPAPPGGLLVSTEEGVSREVRAMSATASASRGNLPPVEVASE